MDNKNVLSTAILTGCLGLVTALTLLYMNGVDLDTILESITKHYFFV